MLERYMYVIRRPSLHTHTTISTNLSFSIFQRVLMMVYHIHNYWGFGLFPMSGILGTRKHDVSETGSVSETSYFLVPTIPDDVKVQKNPVILNFRFC
jgi:hypothetical protein